MSYKHSTVRSDMEKNRSGSMITHKQHCQDFCRELCVPGSGTRCWLITGTAFVLKLGHYGALSQHICSTFWPETWRTATRSSSPLVVDRPLPDLSFCCPLYCLPTSRFRMTRLKNRFSKTPRHHKTLPHLALHHCHCCNPGSVKGVSAWLKSNFRFLHHDCVIEWPSYSSASVCISSVLTQGHWAALLTANPLPVSGWRRGKRW